MSEAIVLQADNQHDLAMKKPSWKEQIRAAASRAATDKQIPRIATETKIRADRLHQFVSKGYLGSDDVKSLADWLSTHGYLEEQEKKEPQTKSIEILIAAEMHALADILASPDIDKEVKGQRFVAAVRGWSMGIDKHAAVFKK